MSQSIAVLLKSLIKEMYREKYVFTLKDIVNYVRNSYTGEKQELFDSLYIDNNDDLDVSMVDSEIEATDFLDASIYKFKNSF